MKKKSRGFWQYDPVIYPRKLWVAIGQSMDDLKNTFTPIDGSEWILPNKDFDGVTFSEMARRDNNKYGELVLFNTKKDMTMNICAHEASHVCDAIEEAIGMGHGDEPSAYLLGWIASCINMARLGIGEFVTIKKEDERINN